MEEWGNHQSWDLDLSSSCAFSSLEIRSGFIAGGKGFEPRLRSASQNQCGIICNVNHSLIDRIIIQLIVANSDPVSLMDYCNQYPPLRSITINAEGCNSLAELHLAQPLLDEARMSLSLSACLHECNFPLLDLDGVPICLIPPSYSALQCIYLPPCLLALHSWMVLFPKSCAIAFLSSCLLIPCVIVLFVLGVIRILLQRLLGK